MKIQQDINTPTKYKINRENVNFQGSSLFLKKIFAPKDTVTLSKEALLNKEAENWMGANLKKYGKDSIKMIYKACANADSNIFQPAFELVKDLIPQAQSSIKKVFSHTENKNVISKFGLNFLSYMLEANKNDKNNHTEKNIEFLTNVIKKFDSKTPTKYLDIVVNSKDSEGNIKKSAQNLFDYFAKKKILYSFSDFMKKLSTLPIENQKLIEKYYTKLSDNTSLFNVLELCQGKDSEKLVQAIYNDLENFEPKDIIRILSHSKSQSGEARLFNYQKIIPIFKNDKNLLEYSYFLKDKKGYINDDNINFVKSISGKIQDKEALKNYAQIVKDDNGIVKKDAAENLIKTLRSFSNKNLNHNNIIYAINQLKNKNNDIQWDFINIFTVLKNMLDAKNPKSCTKLFEQTIQEISDSQGNIIPEFVEKIPALLKEDLLEEIPNIFKMSKFNGKIKENTFSSVVDILKKTNSSDRKEMSKFLTGCIDANGDIDNNKIAQLQEIQNRGIKSNVLKIANALKNKDGEFSKRGLDLIETLRKKGHHQIEEDLSKIVDLCRDSSGNMNSNNINAVIDLQGYKSQIKLSELLKMIQSPNKEVDSNKQKVVIQVIKNLNSAGARTVNKVINLSKDRHGVIDLEVIKLLINLSKKGKDLDQYEDVIPAYRKLYKYEHVTSLSQLNLRQKRDLMQALKNYKSIIQSGTFRSILNPKILPNTDSEYCDIVARLSHSIGINVPKLSKELKADFFKALNNLSDVNSEFMNLDFNNNTPILNLGYSLKDFKNNIWNIVKNSHYSDRTKALDYFGFELKNNNGILEMTGFPSADKPDGRLARIKDKDVLNLITKLTPEVIKFTQNNSVTIQNAPQLSKDLTNIIKAFPEFLTTIGKVQHGTHDFTLDVHCLKVLQGAMKTSLYQTLSQKEKYHMQIIALFHDLTKAEAKPDSDHPKNSAFDVYYLLDKFDMKEKDKLKIYQVIKNHSWLANYDFSERMQKKLAFNMRSGNSFKLQAILTMADLKGVKKNDKFYLQHANKLKSAVSKISQSIEELQSTAINLPQAKIPKASELNTNSKYVSKISKDGINNTVLYLKSGIDLQKAGFKNCKSLNDFNILVHGLDSEDSASMFQALGMIDSKALLSTSYIIYSKQNYRAFRSEGFILDVPATNIHAAYWRDFGSGCKKTVRDLFKTYLFQNNEQRNYISEKLKKELNLSDKEYIKLFNEIEDLTLEELEIKSPKVAKAYRKIFNDMEISKRSYGRNYNEILVTSPKIQAIFCYDKNPQNISPYLRKYAEKNDIPIIVFN